MGQLERWQTVPWEFADVEGEILFLRSTSGYTVQDMYAACEELISAGKGDYLVVSVDDDGPAEEFDSNSVGAIARTFLEKVLNGE